MSERAEADILLDVRDMRVWYDTSAGDSKAVDGVSFAIKRNEVFGLAGESGCGKSTLIKGLLRLAKLPLYIKSGEAIFSVADDAGKVRPVDLAKASAEEVRRLRWRHMSYVPQSAMNALNPVVRIRDQIMDAMLEHSNMSREEAYRKMLEQLTMVGLDPAIAGSFPHELSGGMRQRVTIAAAVSLRPDLLVADEPTTALDVVVQRVILQALKEIREQLNLALLYVTHDMAVLAELADRIAVMYAGLIVEIGSAEDIFANPLHPYTKGLIMSVQKVGGERRRMEGFPGRVPSPLEWPKGCHFHPRCAQASDVCREVEPQLVEVEPGRMVACHTRWSGERHE
jgi:peptide/nickel transport system ATP-binding protein